MRFAETSKWETWVCDIIGASGFENYLHYDVILKLGLQLGSLYFQRRLDWDGNWTLQFRSSISENNRFSFHPDLIEFVNDEILGSPDGKYDDLMRFCTVFFTRVSTLMKALSASQLPANFYILLGATYQKTVSCSLQFFSTAGNHSAVGLVRKNSCFLWIKFGYVRLKFWDVLPFLLSTKNFRVCNVNEKADEYIIKSLDL